MRGKRGILSVILAMAMVFSLFSGLGGAVSAAGTDSVTAGADDAEGDAGGHTYEDGFCTGCGAVDPDAESYIIYTADQLAAIAETVNGGNTFSGKTVALANNIKLTDYEAWDPIGGASTKHSLDVYSQEDLDEMCSLYGIVYDNVGNSYVPNSDKNGVYDENRTYYYLTGAAFGGTFDGQGFTISGLCVDTADGYAGLFGNVSGTVKDVAVEGSVTSTTSQDFVGGIVGKVSAGGTVSGCVSDVKVTADSAYNIGGVAGFVGEPVQMVSGDDGNPMATVENCINYGDVSGYVRVGGVVGRNAGTVTACVNHGTVFNASASQKGIGGIVGMNGVNNTAVDAGIVSWCYNDGHVNGNAGYWSGGIVGFQNSLSVCENCYNAGTLAAAATATGERFNWTNPVVGQNEGTVADCLWLNEDTGDNTKNYVGRDTSGVGNSGGTVTNVTGVSDETLRADTAPALLNTQGTEMFRSSCGNYPVLFYETPEPHTPGETVIENETEATCTENGSCEETVSCTACGAEISRTVVGIPATGHTAVTDEAVEPTCTEPGLTQGSHCSVCGAILTAQEEIPAPGHSWDDGAVTKAATATQEGIMTYTCTVCGDTKTEVIPKTGATDTGDTGDVSDEGDKADGLSDTKAADGNWYYVTASGVRFDYTGVADYRNASGWSYIRNGVVDFTANTVAKNRYGWWYVTGGQVQFGYTGVANYKNAYGWWYIRSGKVDFTFTGKAANRYGTWNVKGGKVIFWGEL